MKLLIFSLIVFGIAFFPAYVGYMPEYIWIGYVFTILFALFAYIPFIRDHKGRGLLALSLLIVFGYSIETIGILTCFPYGCFSYTNQLGIKIANIVPLMLAFTWPPLVLGVWGYVQRIVGPGWKRWILGALSLVVVDLILDPIAVFMGLRSYNQEGIWFGVPLSNFAGRILSGTIAMIILDTIIRKPTIKKSYSYGLWLTLSFFVGYLVWSLVFY